MIMSIANFVGKSSERKMGHYISDTVLAIDTGGYVNNVTMIFKELFDWELVDEKTLPNK